ncbi:MAG: hypothetical protein ACI9GW_001977 [Halieaceae bacterium]|jgi:hypothetical protein
MVAATYTSDLTDIDLMEGVGSITDYGGGGGAAAAGIDYAIEGTNAVDKQINNTERGFLFDNVSNFTIGADDHFYGWICMGTYGLAASRDNRGIVFNIGDDTSNFVKFHVNGVDTLPLGGMIPYAVRFVETTLANFRTPVGTPSATPSQIGCGANTTGAAKFANLAMDAVRIGTGYDILNGTGADPEADFAGIAADDIVAREGILVEVGGGYSLQGKVRVGSAATACEFLDSNTNINIVDTRHSLTDLTEILIEHASSIFTLTNVNFNALGTNNRGRFEVLTAAATIALTNVGFINFGPSIFGSGSTVNGSRWINAGLVTLADGTFNNCSFDSSPEVTAVSAATPAEAAKTNGSSFVSTGTGNGLEIGGTAADLTLTNVDFTGYSLTTDADKAIFVNIATGTMTINIVGGTGVTLDTHVRTAGATVTVSQSVPVDFLVLDKNNDPIANAQVSCYLTADDSVVIVQDTNASGIVSTSFGGTVPADIYFRVRRSSAADSPKYIHDSGVGTIASGNGFSVTRTLRVDPNNNA